MKGSGGLRLGAHRAGQKAESDGAVVFGFRQATKNRPVGRFFVAMRQRAYWLAPDAGAAAEAAASDAAAPGADAIASLAAGAAELAAPVSEAAAAAGAEAADVSLAAGAAAFWSLLLLQAARATAANRDATRRDFFMITSFYG
ncbi:MAG: hypothetical protein QOI13_2767 [Paraburkholderia sp.]|jgi:hypothetical protein|nr:hypothetical protein [Paraburkholderia sp.]